MPQAGPGGLPLALRLSEGLGRTAGINAMHLAAPKMAWFARVHNRSRSAVAQTLDGVVPAGATRASGGWPTPRACMHCHPRTPKDVSATDQAAGSVREASGLLGGAAVASGEARRPAFGKAACQIAGATQ